MEDGALIKLLYITTKLYTRDQLEDIMCLHWFSEKRNTAELSSDCLVPQSY